MDTGDGDTDTTQFRLRSSRDPEWVSYDIGEGVMTDKRVVGPRDVSSPRKSRHSRGTGTHPGLCGKSLVSDPSFLNL